VTALSCRNRQYATQRHAPLGHHGASGPAAVQHADRECTHTPGLVLTEKLDRMVAKDQLSKKAIVWEAFVLIGPNGEPLVSVALHVAEDSQ